MELDARRLDQGIALDADVCIIGAGPAGITLAREFTSSHHAVTLLESGSTHPDPQIQELNDGALIGSPYHGLRRTRHRQVAGSAHLWNTAIEGGAGAKYAPLDPLDFKARREVPSSGWPFGFDHLFPFYQRAHAVCGLGKFDYEGERWSTPERRVLPPIDPALTTRVYHCGAADRFTLTHANHVAGARNIRLVHHATCCALLSEGTEGTRRVVAVEFRSGPQRSFRVRARVFVLAAGAIENARLLLASAGGETALGNRYGWVGTCFMEHPRDYAIRLIPDSPDVFRRIGFYDLHLSHGSWVIGRLALDESTLHSNGFPNLSITLLPRPRRRPWLEAVGWLLDLRARVGQRSETLGYGWSTRPDVSTRCDSVQVLLNVEQFPQRENRVVLAPQRDEYGVPKVELHWQWRSAEQATLNRLRTFVAARLEALGLGRVEVSNERQPDPNAHHHAGTTRLSTDPQNGVADANALVHGAENVYLAGASLFPTAGFANPTLTIVALAIRLADHLKGRL